jgi:hypothetical protein
MCALFGLVALYFSSGRDVAQEGVIRTTSEDREADGAIRDLRALQPWKMTIRTPENVDCVGFLSISSRTL